MTLPEDRVVLAVECGACQQLTAVPTYDGAQQIARCGSCGGRFHAAETLMNQYQTSAERLAKYDTLMQALQEVQHAMTAALEQVRA